MSLLRQLVERDQWAELVTDSQSINENIRSAEIEILAFSEKEAIKKAINIFQINAKSLQYDLLSKGSSKLIGLIKTPSRYVFSIKPEILQTLKKNIDYNEHNQLASNKNGTFQLQMRMKGLQLIVFPPDGMGKSVSVTEIEKELEAQGYKNVDRALIQKALLNPNKKQALAPYRKGVKDASIGVEIQKDAMSTTVTIGKPGQFGRMPEPSEIIQTLHSLNVTYGINEQMIHEMIENDLYDIPIVVAEGTPVEHGQDAWIEFSVPINTNTLHAVRQDGSIDFKELNMIHNVHKGDVIATMHKATQGITGSTVTNEKIIANPGQPINWNIGSNVVLSQDQTQAIASISGQIVIKENDLISVDPVLEIPSDVDLSVGNIDFLGNVVIKGNVTDGFSVIAGGNIEIHGHIGKCFIHAAGNIIAHQGIQGKDENRIECDGDLFARFVERSNMTIGGNIIISKSLLHSHVICEKSIYVIGDKKAIIAGGDIKALNEIICKQFGAESYIETHIEAGYSQKLIAEITSMHTALADKEKKISAMKSEMTSMADRLSQTQRVKLERLLHDQTQQYKQLERTIASKKSQLHQLQNAASISAELAFMPGVKAKIGDISSEISIPQKGGSLKINGSTLGLSQYAPSAVAQKYSEQENTNKKKRR